MNKNWRSRIFKDLQTAPNESVVNQGPEEEMFTEKIKDYFQPDFSRYVEDEASEEQLIP